MSEIATTARIRELFTDGGFWNSDVFDEWLEKHDAEVAKATEAHIIKLLEDPATMSNWWAMPDKSLGLYGNLKNYVIELIKGETK
jgi:hypothetical protein